MGEKIELKIVVVLREQVLLLLLLSLWIDIWSVVVDDGDDDDAIEMATRFFTENEIIIKKFLWRNGMN